MALAALIVRIGADLTDLNKGLTQVDRDVQKLGRRMQRVGQDMSLYLTAPLAAIGGLGVKSAQQLETFGASLRVLVGDAKRANAVFDQLYQFSAGSPFNWRDLSDGTRLLASFGVEAEKIVPTLKRIGDISSGTNNNIAEMAELYGKARVQGRLFGEDINQLTGRGVPIIQELAKQFGVAESEVKALVSEGRVGFKHLEQAFISLTEEGGKFFGLTEAMANTSAGRMMRLKDSLEQVLDVVGARLLPTFDGLVTRLQGATDWFVGLSSSTQTAMIVVGGLVAAIGPLLMALGHLLTMLPLIKSALVALTGPVGAVTLAVGLLAAAWLSAQGRAKDAADAHDSMVSRMTAGIETLTTAERKHHRTIIAKQLQRAEAQLKVVQAAVDAERRIILPADALAIASVRPKNLPPSSVRTTPTGTTRTSSLKADLAAQQRIVDALRESYDRAMAAAESGMEDVAGATKTTTTVLGTLKDRLDEIATLGRAVALGLGDTSAIGRLNAAERELRRQAMDTNRTYEERVNLMEAANRAARDLFSHLNESSPTAALARKRPTDPLAAPRPIRSVGHGITAINQRSDLQMPSAFSQFVDGLRNGIEGVVKQFGPLAAAAAVLAPVFQGLRDALGPVITALAEPLRVFGQLIGSLIVPVLSLLVPPLRLLAIAVSYVVEAFGWLIRSVGKLVDALPFISGKGIIKAGQDMMDGAREARRAMGGAADAADRLAGALSNVPRVLNIAGLRHRTTGGIPGAPPPFGGPGGGPPGGGTTIYIHNINANVADADQFLDQLGALSQRVRSRGGTSRLELALT